MSVAILRVVMPDRSAGPRVERPNVIGNGEIHDAVHDQRRAFDRWIAHATLCADAGYAIDPARRQRPDGCCINLRLWREAAPGISAVVGGQGPTGWDCKK